MGLQLVLWVFVLSIHWNQKTLFSHLNNFLVKNALVQSMDQELTILWQHATKTTKVSFSDNDKGKSQEYDDSEESDEIEVDKG